MEVLVADGHSTDRTCAIAREHDRVTVVDNPGRIQSAGMNYALAKAHGEIVVRVDGHCVLEPDYVDRCVAALTDTGAAMVGGAMSPDPARRNPDPARRRLGDDEPTRCRSGPVPHRRPSWLGLPVYLGAYRLSDVHRVGGYAEDVGVNEDAELALRLGSLGGVWFDPTIRSSYVPRPSVTAVAKQFYRYGRSRERPPCVVIRGGCGHGNLLRLRSSSGSCLRSDEQWPRSTAPRSPHAHCSNWCEIPPPRRALPWCFP